MAQELLKLGPADLLGERWPGPAVIGFPLRIERDRQDITDCIEKWRKEDL